MLPAIDIYFVAEMIMRARIALMSAALITAGSMAAGQAPKRLNPMIDLMVAKKPVFGLYAPTGTPKDVIALLNREISVALQSEALQARMAAIAAQGLTLSPDAFAARNAAEFQRMSALIRETGLSAK